MANPVSPSASSSPHPDTSPTVKDYNDVLNRLFVVRWSLMLIVVAVYLISGLSQQLADGLRATFSSPWIYTGLYVAITVFGWAVLMFPLSLYEEHAVEKAFGNSEESLGDWFHFYVRGLLIEIGLVVVFSEVVYALLRNFPGTWWFWTALFYIGAVIVFSTLAPVVILPLFFKAKPILEAPWLPRVRRMLNDAHLPNINIFEWGFSDRTHTENVVLAGIGKTRRILIADTALKNHTDDEIVAFVAHELGHYRHGDMWRAIVVDGVIALAGFYIAHNVLIRLAPAFGMASPADIAGFPILVFSLFILTLIVMPAVNTVSRHREYAADTFAVEIMGTAEPLIRGLTKAAEQNMADPHPPALLETLLHSHPSLVRRIEHARRVQQTLENTSPETQR